MSKQLVDMIEAVAYEKSMPQDLVRAAMESAISALARREQKAPGGVFRTDIEKDGSVHVVRVWSVVDEIADPEKEVSWAIPSALTENAEKDASEILETVDTPQWTRQGLQVVKQVLAQKLKQGLRTTIAEAWQNRVGDVVMGVVKRADKSRIVLDLGEPVEGVISGKDRIPGEMFRIGQRCRALVTQVNAEGMGPVITLSRSADDFVKELVSIEVPEVDLGQVIIRAVARDPGARAKIAVEAGNGLRNHPAAVCVGMRGVRAQAVSNEINGERLEFIQWSDVPAELVIAALAPAEVSTLVLDENDQRAMVGVDKENLARAIGSRGQNVRLAARLTGWNIELMSTEELQIKRQAEDQEAIDTLCELMDMDQEMAELLVSEGMRTVEDIHYSSLGDLLMIEGFDEELAQELKDRAENAVLLAEMLAVDDSQDESIQLDLTSLSGITAEDVTELNRQNINTLADLADMGVMDVEWNEERDEQLSSWIMEARKRVGMI